MRRPPEHLIVGPDRHGVVRFGIALQEALDARGFPMDLRRSPGIPPDGLGLHLQFTDRLFGADARQAAVAVCALAAEVRRGGGRVTATLHDLPQPSDGVHHSTRAGAYAALSTALDAVVISSDHERILLSDCGFRGRSTVIPLPVGTTERGRVASSQPPSVGVFGFVYPGKGHAEVLDAMQGLPTDVRMLAIGEPSAGHEDLIDELAASARAQRRSFVLTGHVPDDALTPLLHEVTVPVTHHRHVSASGSLNSWLAAGRRPLAPSTRYTREIATRNPGALMLYDDDCGSLATALRGALDDPTSTWLANDFTGSPTPDQAAARYARFLAGVHG